MAQAQPRGPESVSALAAELSPAVVNIGTSRRVPSGGGTPFPEFPEGSPLGEMFDQLNPNAGQGRERMEEARSLGSGFIISADGYVVTNNHVIDGAEEIYVFLTDGRRLPATLAGKDDKTDLAVLKVDADTPLPFVEFGDSDSAEVGDWVMAIGNPFGLGGSVTLGIVSARNRDINSGPYDNFIQTDASINQGNSGGPLFDMYGKVVGINTAIIARGGSSLGIGFAVPGNLARPVIEQLAEFGETRRGWLGVGIQEVDEDIALSLGRPNTQGAMVVDIDPTGPSVGRAAGGRPDPAVRRQDSGADARPAAHRRRDRSWQGGAGDGAAQWRRTNGRYYPGPAGSAHRPVPTSTAAPAETEAPEDLPGGLLGIVGFSITLLDEEARAEFGIDDAISGVIITEVIEGTDAYAKGLIPGLMITEVNQTPWRRSRMSRRWWPRRMTANREAVLLKVTDPAGSSRFIAVRLD